MGSDSITSAGTRRVLNKAPLLVAVTLLFLLMVFSLRHIAADKAGSDKAAGASSGDKTPRICKSEVRAVLKLSLKGAKEFARARDRIKEWGKAAESGLVSRLAAKDPKERTNVLRFLGMLKSKSCTTYFLEKKRDPDPEVRMEAIESLKALEDADLIEKIANAYLADTHPSVRDVAIITLGSFKDERAVKHLVKALDDTDEYARECARKGLSGFSGRKIDEKGKKEEDINAAWKKWFAKWNAEQAEKKDREKKDAENKEKRDGSEKESGNTQ